MPVHQDSVGYIGLANGGVRNYFKKRKHIDRRHKYVTLFVEDCVIALVLKRTADQYF